VVPSPVVAEVVKTEIASTGSKWYSFYKKDVSAEYRDFWGAFNEPGARSFPRRP
jgi:hypothetical protein